MLLEKNFSKSWIVPLSKDFVRCGNLSCIQKIKAGNREIYLNKLEVSVLKTKSTVEVCVRCPYCHNFICSFNLNGYDPEIEGVPKIPDSSWERIITRCRDDYTKQKFNKKFFNYSDLK